MKQPFYIKAKRLTLALALTMIGSVHCFAADNSLSLDLDAGANFIPDITVGARASYLWVKQDISFDPGLRLGAALNYNLTRETTKPFGFGIGLESAFIYNDFTKLEAANLDSWISQVPFLGKVSVYTDPSKPLQAILGAGIGGDWTHVEEVGGLSGSDDVSLAWEAEASIRYRLNDKLSLGIIGKYLGVDSPSIGEVYYALTPYATFYRKESQPDYIHNFSIGLVMNVKL